MTGHHSLDAKLLHILGTVEGHFVATGVRPRFLSELAARGIKIPGSYFDPSKPL